MTRVENIRRIAFTAIPIALILAACSSATPEQTVVVVTEAPDGGTTEATALPAEIPTAVPIAPTPGSGDPTLTAKVNTAVRSGPGTNYPVYAFMSGGQTATLAGTNDSGTHYAIVVTVASTGTGWIDAQFADISNAGDLAIIEAPPPPPSTSFSPPAPGEPAVVAQESVGRLFLAGLIPGILMSAITRSIGWLDTTSSADVASRAVTTLWLLRTRMRSSARR